MNVKTSKSNTLKFGTKQTTCKDIRVDLCASKEALKLLSWIISDLSLYCCEENAINPLKIHILINSLVFFLILIIDFGIIFLVILYK